MLYELSYIKELVTSAIDNNQQQIDKLQTEYFFIKVEH